MTIRIQVRILLVVAIDSADLEYEGSYELSIGVHDSFACSC